MSDEFDTNDDVLFDRLVDGELPAAQRRALVASLDDRPGGWRQCALAFLEAQAWRRDLGGLVAGEPREVSSVAQRAADSERRPRQTVSLSVLAASMLIAFTLGLALRLRSLPPQIATPNSTHQIATAGPEQRASAQAAKPDDAVTFFVRDASGQTRPLRVPLVDAGVLDRQLGLQFQPALPTGVRDELEQNGYQVESKRRYAPLWLENGRPLVVPVEDTRIVPVSRPVY